MSERVTIGNVVYETIGSSSSNLLLRCNGTARIQWGTKLIDLVKNGKIGSESDFIYIISDEKEMKSDGIYIINKEEGSEFFIYKKGNKYNLSKTDLYVSADVDQKLTSEQQLQVLLNVGLYYNTLEELQNSEIKNGIGYVIENQTLYNIKNGVIESLNGTIVQVENDDIQENVINSQTKIVLSISNDEYIVLEENSVKINYPVHVNSIKSNTFKLYQEGNKSYLQVDNSFIDTLQVNSITADGFKLYYKETEPCLEVDNAFIDTLQVNNLQTKNQFVKGMIIMFSGSEIPEGWAICDGNSYVYNGVTTTTPNLTNRFIKAVSSVENIGAVDNDSLNENNRLMLKDTQLPPHKHTIPVVIDGTDTYGAVLGGVSEDNIETNNIEYSQEEINIEPNYYSLIFIMKL